MAGNLLQRKLSGISQRLKLTAIYLCVLDELLPACLESLKPTSCCNHTQPTRKKLETERCVGEKVGFDN